jgi:hypothetical protein
VAAAQVTTKAAAPVTVGAGVETAPTSESPGEQPSSPGRPHRFFGSVEIDAQRPIKAFEAVILNVIEQLQRTNGTKVTITLDIQAACDAGFSADDVSVVRDNARQLKFKSESTSFE